MWNFEKSKCKIFEGPRVAHPWDRELDDSKDKMVIFIGEEVL